MRCQAPQRVRRHPLPPARTPGTRRRLGDQLRGRGRRSERACTGPGPAAAGGGACPSFKGFFGTENVGKVKKSPFCVLGSRRPRQTHGAPQLFSGCRAFTAGPRAELTSPQHVPTGRSRQLRRRHAGQDAAREGGRSASGRIGPGGQTREQRAHLLHLLRGILTTPKTPPAGMSRETAL